jgi:hypothetical protein
LFELVLFSGEYPFEDGAVGHIRFVTGVLGATMAGWGVLLGFILWRPFGERRRWAWWAVATSLGVWFALDTGLSCVSGYWENALLNTVVVAAFVPALGATYRSTTP